MNLSEVLNSINANKEDVSINPSFAKEYTPFVVNRCMSYFVDTIFFANDMNTHHHLTTDQQYKYYLYSVKKGKRFSRWVKRDSIDDIDVVMKYFNYSYKKATQAIEWLSEYDLNTITTLINTGGTSK